MNIVQKLSATKLKSVEDASVIRKFAVFFSLMSFLPFVILSSLLFLFIFKGEIKIEQNLLFWAVFAIGVLSLIGFFSMRQTLIKLARVSENVKAMLKGDFSRRINIKSYGDNEVAQLARAFNEIVQQLEQNIEQLEKSKKTVQGLLLKVSSGASFAQNLDAFLDLILSTTVEALEGKIGMLLVLDEEKNELVIRSIHGAAAAYRKEKRIPLDDEVVGWIVRHKRPLLIPRLHKAANSTAGALAFEPPLIGAPLILQNKVLGVIAVNGKRLGNSFEEEELVILSNIASQIAWAIENARLNENNQKAYFETIAALAMAVEARDIYSRGHSDRVGEYAINIAKQLGLDKQRIKTIQDAAQLHDVGKIGISDDILQKADALGDVERTIMEQHPIIGEGIIIPLHDFAHLRDPLRHHHEWLNGEGYPDHLKGDEISLEARILAVADCFDAMTTDRPYKKAESFQAAKEELLHYAGERYDPNVINALVSYLKI